MNTQVLIPDAKALQSAEDNSDRKTLREVVNCLSVNLQWKTSLCSCQAFCWKILSACCEHIPVSALREELEKHSTTIEQLCRVYQLYCGSKYEQSDVRRVLEDELPRATTQSEHIQKYFNWIRAIQQVSLHWKGMFASRDVSYSDIQLYRKHHKYFLRLAQDTCVPRAEVSMEDTDIALCSFKKQYDALNFALIKYIHGKPDIT